MSKPKFNFYSLQKHQHGGKKTLKKVNIKNGRGTKSVSYYNKGKHVHTSKKHLSDNEIGVIELGKFIPGLFKDCSCNKNKTRKNKK